MSKKKVVIIGAGFGGLGAACLFAKAGYEVSIYEKNDTCGGRASLLEEHGFRFDMGPSWYLMPDVFEHFFSLLGEDLHQYISLQQLSPSYRIFDKQQGKQYDMYADVEKTIQQLDIIEPGAGEQFRRYLAQSKKQYEIAYDRFLFKNYSSVWDFFTWEVLTQGYKLSVFSTMDRYVKRFFKTSLVQKIMQYTLVFLGSSPYNTPALYNIMTHVDFNMGVFYPQGGIYEVTKALEIIAKKYKAKIYTNAPVSRIIVNDGHAKGIALEDGRVVTADIVISNADYQFTETRLLETQYQSYTDAYWKKTVMAPSAFIMYLGIDSALPELTHHNLVFSEDWRKNFSQIFDEPVWPSDPSYYVCNPSKTDDSVAPKGKENIFVLVPIAPGLSYTEDQLQLQANTMIERMANDFHIPDLKQRIVFQKLFCVKDFEQRYNSFQGTALGMAHTLKQTAIFRPDTKSKKVDQLYFVGAGTNPGIGMPICLISAELVYKRVIGDTSSGPLSHL